MYKRWKSRFFVRFSLLATFFGLASRRSWGRIISCGWIIIFLSFIHFVLAMAIFRHCRLYAYATHANHFDVSRLDLSGCPSATFVFFLPPTYVTKYICSSNVLPFVYLLFTRLSISARAATRTIGSIRTSSHDSTELRRLYWAYVTACLSTCGHWAAY